VKNKVAIFLLLLIAMPAWAQEKLKIGVVDIQRVISESQAGKAAKDKFQTQVRSRRIFSGKSKRWRR